MIRSMTGFGSAEGQVGAASVTVDVRSVNHRFFNPSLKLPSAYQRWEGDVRELLRQRIARGHVTLTARIERGTADGLGELLAIDEVRLARYAAQLRDIAMRIGIDPSLDFATMLRLPDVVTVADDPGDIGDVSELLAIVSQAADALMAMRDAEGGRLAGYLAERLVVIEGALDRLAARAPQRLVEQRDRLRAAVLELSGGVGIDEQRIAQEIAVLADRLDVQEELERFRSHLVAFRDTLQQGGGSEPVGKRLGFLLQELLREANTTGSKSNDVAMVREVMVIKEELERIREQVENLE